MMTIDEFDYFIRNGEADMEVTIKDNGHVLVNGTKAAKCLKKHLFSHPVFRDSVMQANKLMPRTSGNTALRETTKQLLRRYR